MAYTKQEWVDDDDVKGKVNATRMTHIEDGIYDNSLATDKINPSGTATTTAEIEEGQITDVIGFKSLKLKGQTSQYTTTGKNLCNEEFVQGGTTNNTSTDRISCRNIQLKANTTYTLSSDLNYSNFNIAITHAVSEYPISVVTDIIYDSGWKTANFSFTTGDSNVYSNISVRKADNSNLTPSTVSGNHFQLEEGSSATSYEKYSGGKASPNPDFPQEVNNVSGDNVVKIKNKNLWQNANNQVVSSYGITLTTNDDNSVTMTGSATNSSIYFTNVKKIMAEDIRDGNYTISFGNGSNTSFIAYRLRKYDGTTKTEIKAPTTLAATNYTYTFNLKNLIDDDTIQVELDLVRYGTGANDQTLYPQIEAGSTASSYAKYQGNEYEINLGKNLIEDTFKGYNINAQGKFETGGTSVDFDVQIARVMQGVTYTITPSTNVIAYFNEKPTTSSTSYNGSREVITNTNTLTPTKSGYIAIRTAASDTAQLEKGANATSYAPYFPPIEICKISTYQDYIFKKDGKWWKHKAIEKIILNGSESWVLDGELTNTNRFRLGITSYNIQNIALTYNGFSNQLPILNAYSDESEHLYTYKPSSIMNLYVFYTKTRCADLAGLQTWLSANNLIIYGILNTPIEEEITYTPLIRQLDELYNSGLYDVTNISQDNSSEAFILDIEACKNNINGIVEYIRR